MLAEAVQNACKVQIAYKSIIGAGAQLNDYFRTETVFKMQILPRHKIIYSVMPALKRTRLTASAWRKANWCINCVLMRVMERHERDNS